MSSSSSSSSSSGSYVKLTNYLYSLQEAIRNTSLGLESPWYGGGRIEEALRLSSLSHDVCVELEYQLFTDGIQIKDEDRTKYLIDLLGDLHEEVYVLLISRYKSLTDRLPSSDVDPFDMFYSLQAMFHLSQILLHDSRNPDKLNILTQTGAPSLSYCRAHNLVYDTIPVGDMSVSQLYNSLGHLEKEWNKLPYHVELMQYLGMLELRAAHIIIYEYTTTTHDMEKFRKATSKENIYMCSDEFISEMATRFVCLRITMQTIMCDMRISPQTLHSMLMPTLSEIENLREILITTGENVYTDVISDTFRKTYKWNSLLPSELLLYRRKNGGKECVEPLLIVEDMRGKAMRAQVNKRACEDAQECLKIGHTDRHIGVPIAVHLLLNILTQQEASFQWENYSLFDRFVRDNLDDLIEMSVEYPLIVESFHERGILWKKQLYVFGAEPDAILTAVVIWLKIIHYEMYDCLTPSISIRKLYKYLLN